MGIYFDQKSTLRSGPKSIIIFFAHWSKLITILIFRTQFYDWPILFVYFPNFLVEQSTANFKFLEAKQSCDFRCFGIPSIIYRISSKSFRELKVYKLYGYSNSGSRILEIWNQFFSGNISDKTNCSISDSLDHLWGIKGFNKSLFYRVKLPYLRAVRAGQEWILPIVKWVNFFLGPWFLVYQFIDISNQMEPTEEVSNVEQKNLCNALLYKKYSFDFLSFASCLRFIIWNVYKLAH